MGLAFFSETRGKVMSGFYTEWMTVSLFVSGITSILNGVVIAASGRIFSRTWKRAIGAALFIILGVTILLDVPHVQNWVQSTATLVRWGLMSAVLVCMLAIAGKLEDKNSEAPLRSFKWKRRD